MGGPPGSIMSLGSCGAVDSATGSATENGVNTGIPVKSDGKPHVLWENDDQKDDQH